ncbi:lysosome membrane protein 2c isoform X2 [Pseudoliparis swirei]|uniref:lysosome membrane protein 2c isoform X2 n=1 Tax=Pseudoliparis swirei TaxID=2059687 RepID=UPI0024BDAEAB|nr:lysosome membrane protein 2c isoform X2 [Pseudoliparis swirei]
MLLKTCCIYSIGVFSNLILISGIALVLSDVFPRLLKSVVEKEIVLKNGTEAFKAWENPPAPIYMQFYFFNVTNPLEVLEGERPAVIEIGPYTYREYRPMEQVDFQENGTKVAAVNIKTYIFQRNMSRGPESELIRTVNIPAMTVMEQFKDHSMIAKLISAYMKSSGDGLFTTRTAGELLWGYKDGLLTALKKFKPDLDDVFGLFYKSNASSDGDYVFFTGQQNHEDFARVDTWNGDSKMSWWTSDECNMINGTNGASFHPVISKNETLYMFSSDLCRSLYVLYEEEVTVKGIPGYRFIPPSKVFANKTLNPANAGFCVPAENCLGSGVLNVSPCKQGAPIIMSSPHFYQADEKYVQGVFGMRPQKEQHQTMIDINPLTGIIVRAAKRFQVNVNVEKIPVFEQTGNVRTVIFPVVYLNESVVIDDSSAGKLQKILAQRDVVVNIPFMLIGLGIILGGVFMFLMCRQKSTATERQPLLSS